MGPTLSLLIMKIYLPLEKKCIVWTHQSSLPTSTLQSPFISQQLMFKMEVSSHESSCCKQLFLLEIFKKNHNKAQRQIKMTSSKQKHIKAYRKKKIFFPHQVQLNKKDDSDNHSPVTHRDARVYIPDYFIWVVSGNCPFNSTKQETYQMYLL